MRTGLAGVVAMTLILSSGVVLAGAPERSLRPPPRPVAEVDVAAAAILLPPLLAEAARSDQIAVDPSPQVPSLRPRPRPERLVPAAPADTLSTKSTHLAVLRSLRPMARPEDLGRESLVQVAAPVRPAPGAAVVGQRGALCGVPGLEGVTLSRIASSVSGCGIEQPVKVTSVAGVALSTPATVDCATAKALHTWVEQAVLPTVGRKGGGVSSLQIASHYSCRPRNNQAGARISEHGRGRAIDVSAIRLKDGTALTVLGGWKSADQGPILQKLHKAACGPFGTVLGPASDKFHQDHFHFDTARYRSGTYCR